MVRKVNNIMSMLTVSVLRTAGAGPGSSHGDPARLMARRALGEGPIAGTLGPDGRPLAALVLMTEPAVPGVTVDARPVSMLQLEIDGVRRNELVCVTVGERDLSALGDLADPASNEPLCEAVHRLHPNHRCVVHGGQDMAHAENALDAGRRDFRSLSGAPS